MATEPLLAHACDARIKVADVRCYGAPGEAARRLGVAFPERLLAAVESRQFEFIAGRAAALRALGDAGFRGQAELQAPEGRAPRWPEGFTGSIAHSQGLAWAVAGQRVRFLAVGVDLERLLEDGEALELAPAVMDAAEQEAARACRLGFGAHVALVFSAKESFYKCLQPLVGAEFEFLDLLAGPVDAGLGLVPIQLKRPLTDRYPAGYRLEVRFRISDAMVWTAVAIRSDHCPALGPAPSTA